MVKAEDPERKAPKALSPSDVWKAAKTPWEWPRQHNMLPVNLSELFTNSLTFSED